MNLAKVHGIEIIDKNNFLEFLTLKEIEELVNSIEHKEIYETIQSRIDMPKSDYVSIEDMAKKLNINMSNL